MAKIRVLVVDDAVVVRRVISDVLAADPEIEVVGFASNGRLALQKIPQVNPDLLTLDVEMPEMDGLATLEAVRKSYPRLPVIMYSTLTESGAATTLKALALGASDYVTKPANVGSIGEARERIRSELIGRIKALCRRPPAVSVPRPPFRASGETRIDLLAIGCSTGGPNALTEIFRALGPEVSVPILVTQHMPPLFTRYLAQRLGDVSGIPVMEAVAGTPLTSGHVYVAPGDFHLTVVRKPNGIMLALDQGPPENSCRPAVDPMLRSVAAIFGSRTLAVILTGMGQDGLRGVTAVREAGGSVLVQDQASSVVWGMPGAVAQAGLADQVLPLSEMPAEITRRLAVGRLASIAPH